MIETVAPHLGQDAEPGIPPRSWWAGAWAQASACGPARRHTGLCSFLLHRRRRASVRGPGALSGLPRASDAPSIRAAPWQGRQGASAGWHATADAPAMSSACPLPPFRLEGWHLGDLLHRGRHNPHGGPFPMGGGPPKERWRKANLHVDDRIGPRFARFLGELLEGPVRPAIAQFPHCQRADHRVLHRRGEPPADHQEALCRRPHRRGGRGACNVCPPHPTTLSSRPRLVRVPRRRDTEKGIDRFSPSITGVMLGPHLAPAVVPPFYSTHCATRQPEKHGAPAGADGPPC